MRLVDSRDGGREGEGWREVAREGARDNGKVDQRPVQPDSTKLQDFTDLSLAVSKRLVTVGMMTYNALPWLSRVPVVRDLIGYTESKEGIKKMNAYFVQELEEHAERTKGGANDFDSDFATVYQEEMERRKLKGNGFVGWFK